MTAWASVDPPPEPAGRAAVLAKQLIRSENGVFQFRAADKRHVLEELARRSAADLGLAAETVLKALVRREDLGSTGMGRGIAIPHARMDEVLQPFGLFAVLKPPVPFDAIDDRPVDLLFMLLLPARTPGAQLNALACAARSLHDPARAEQLRRARGSLAVYALLTGS